MISARGRVSSRTAAPFIAGLLFCFGAALLASPRLYYQSTPHIEVIYYSPAHEYLVAHLIRSFEHALAFERNLFHYTPSEKVTVLLQDFNDFGYGGAGTVPYNFISVGLAPFSYTYETLPASERMAWIMNHELVHVVMGDNPGGMDPFFRKLFGGKVAPNADDPLSMAYSSLTSPRHYSPRWFHEGIAAWMETWMAGGLGRALGGYDEMVFRAMVRDEAYIYDVVGLESEGSTIDFQTGANAYLYGTRFMNHLALKYGPEKLLKWITRENGTKRYFAGQFERAFGVPMAKEWRAWIADEKVWQNENLRRIRQYPVTPIQRVTKTVLGSVSRPWFDAENRKIYAAVRYPGRMAHIAAIDLQSGEIEHLKDLKGSALYYVASIALDARGQRIFYTTDNNAWRDLNVFDVRTKRSRRLAKDARTGDLAWDARDGWLWGIRHNNGLSSLVRFTGEMSQAALVHEFPYGSDLFDIDVSPDGAFLTGALADMTGRQKLVRYRIADLLAGKAEPEVLHDFEYNSPGNFVHSADGRYLYGSSYYTGVSNLFRYDTQTRSMDVVSNAETGLFRPVPLGDGSVLAFEYTAKGFAPVRVKVAPLEDVAAIRYLGQAVFDKHPELKTWKIRAPETEVPIESAGSYSPVRRIRPISFYPVVQGYKDTTAAGMRFEFSDALRIAGVDATLSYSPSSALRDSERVHGSFVAHWWDWKLSGYYNNADFYDLFGPTKVSRKGYGLRLDHHKTLLYDTPRTLDLDWGVAGYAGMETLPEYQNVAAPRTRFLRGDLALSYKFFDRSIGAVDDEKGVAWRIATRANYAGRDFFPRIHAEYDRGWLLPLRNSSFWVRTSAGKAFGDPNDPFANFFFGGFGNNWIDHLSTSRYREFYSFPGVALNAIPASNYGKGLLEWNLPPWRFRRLGATYLYLNWARVSLFGSGLATNVASAPERQSYFNLGSQLDVRIVIFTYLSGTFSTGYAGATDRHGHTSSEYMVSLKIL